MVDYEQILSEGFTLVDFYSETCGSCKVVSKILEDIACELPFVNILKVKTTFFPKIGTDNSINAVHKVFFVKDGETLKRVVGLMDRDEVLEKIGEHYYG